YPGVPRRHTTFVRAQVAVPAWVRPVGTHVLALPVDEPDPLAVSVGADHLTRPRVGPVQRDNAGDRLLDAGRSGQDVAGAPVGGQGGERHGGLLSLPGVCAGAARERTESGGCGV